MEPSIKKRKLEGNDDQSHENIEYHSPLVIQEGVQVVPDSVDTITSSGYTQSEVEERAKQREKNREAAQKCRNKKKMRESKLTEENNQLKSENTVLKYQVSQWKNETEKLRRAISEHLSTCNVRDISLHQMTLMKDGFICAAENDNSVDNDNSNLTNGSDGELPPTYTLL